MKISVVIPAYNESSSIGIVIDKMLRLKRGMPRTTGVSEIEVIVVNDASKDDTARVVSHYAGDVRLINLTSRSHYGGALKIGFKEASGELIAFLDGDCTYPPESLFELYQAQVDHNADLVVGSRFLSAKAKMSKVRYLGNKLFVFLINRMTQKKMTDAASGMRLFKRDILSELHPLPDGLEFTVAMTVRALYKNLKVVEVPICYGQRVGRSKLNIVTDGAKFIGAIFSTAPKRRRIAH
ncbi:MAG: glycosyltransferase family 2 protein [Candidatus Omnitrophica bacterium]|nr:glycosyltransferase family 2 protein [Candidatus Omnitrophota bacterium]